MYMTTETCKSCRPKSARGIVKTSEATQLWDARAPPRPRLGAVVQGSFVVLGGGGGAESSVQVQRLVSRSWGHGLGLGAVVAFEPLLCAFQFRGLQLPKAGSLEDPCGLSDSGARACRRTRAATSSPVFLRSIAAAVAPADRHRQARVASLCRCQYLQR